MEIKFDAEAVMIPHHIYDNEDQDLIKQAMIEFARIHVQRALRAAVDNIQLYQEPYDDDNNQYVDYNSILNAYPLENIK